MKNPIYERRSIRKFKSAPVAKSEIDKILRAGIAAPSAKNRQPWRFIVATGAAKDTAVDIMRQGLEREKTNPLLPDSARYLHFAHYTADVMTQAPAIIFIVYPSCPDFNTTLDIDGRITEMCDMQSIGAAIQNMTLAATQSGLGSLWVCDTFFALKELNEYLNADGILAAALCIGCADESPAARPRKDFSDTVKYL